MKSFFASVMALIGVAVIFLAIGQPVKAEIIIANSDFETVVQSPLVPTDGIPPAGWTLTGIGGTAPSNPEGLGWPYGPLGSTHGLGNQCAFIEGWAPNVASMSQNVDGWATDATYTLTFWASGGTGGYAGYPWGPDPLQVSVGSTVLTFSAATSITPPNAGQWYTSDPFTAPAAGVNNLAFLGLGPLVPPYPVSIIDNVSVTTIPEPSTLVLLAFGLVGVAAYVRRR
jgi:hypothetical protein